MFSVELELEEGMVTQLWLHRDWQLLLVTVLSSPLFGKPPGRKTLPQRDYTARHLSRPVSSRDSASQVHGILAVCWKLTNPVWLSGPLHRACILKPTKLTNVNKGRLIRNNIIAGNVTLTCISNEANWGQPRP